MAPNDTWVSRQPCPGCGALIRVVMGQGVIDDKGRHWHLACAAKELASR